MTALELLSTLSSKDIEIWADGDRLRYNAPKGALTPDLRKELVARKSEILALLRQSDKVTSATSCPLKPISRTSDLALSFAQQRLWFLHQLGTSSAYNLRLAIHLEGSPNIKALEESLIEIIRRHEALRTTFRSEGGRPVQVIAESIPFELPLVDLSGQPKAEQKVEIGRLTRDESMRRFDLARGPLLNVALIRLSEVEHVLLLTMHHIVSDGWSMGVFTAELKALYKAFCNHEASPLTELPIQYADFAHWQREWLQGEVLENQLSYWREQLEGAPVLQLFTDRPRPAVQTFAGASQNIALSPTLTRALNDLSQRQGATLFMTLLAVFQTLLFRYTGQEDIVVGSPIANRNRTEIEGLIGFFVNSLAMRTDLSGNPSFLKLLERVGEVAMGAYAHQDLPFEKLVEALHLERDMSRTPLFQIMFAVQSMPVEEPQLPGLTLSSFPIERITVRFDIEIFLWDKPEGLSGRVVYNTDLFDDATIQRLMANYETLLESIVADPEQCISDAPILSDTERKQILADWNNTSSKYLRSHCVHQLFEQQAQKSPDAVAVVHGDEQLTYRDLDTRANQLAHHLKSFGVGPEVLVGICLERSLEMIVAVLGILKAGGAYVPLDPEYPMARLRFMLADTRSPVLLTRSRLVEELPPHEAKVICIDSDWDAIARHSQEAPFSATSVENMAYVIYTSGSTGKPKGVAISHGGLLNLVFWHRNVFEVTASDRATQLAGTAFDASVWEVWPYLSAGAQLQVVSAEKLASPEQLRDWLVSKQITLAFVPTPLAEQILKLDWPQQMPLRTLLTGGDKLHRRPSESIPFKVVNNYGPTENTVVTTSGVVFPNSDAAMQPPIGRPISNTKVYILDERLRPVPVGAPGELCIGGASLARGYLNRSELTAEKFMPNPYSDEPGARLYKSGDSVRYLPDGNIEFLGRRDHQVKIRGFRIELGEVESVLGRHPAVEEAVVIAREDMPGDKRLAAYVVAEHDPPLTFSEMRSFLKEKLPDYMIPSAIVNLDALPITSNGKVDRRALPAPDVVRPDLQEAFVAPRRPSEELVAGIWNNVLGLERIGVHDNFFELGGHSLLVVQIISRIRQVFEVELPVRALFEAPTVAELTERIEAVRRSDEELTTYPLQAVSRNQDLPLSFSQERLWFLHHLEPDSVAYSLPQRIRLEGLLRQRALEKTFIEIARRHEILRTTFHDHDGNLVLHIADRPIKMMDILDLRHLPKVEGEAEAKRLSLEDARKPFDLSQGPLLRIQLYQLEEEVHVLHFNMHHIISDGWSYGVMAREITALYTAFVKGQPADLPELPVQYADYAVWQRKWLQAEALEAQLNYWKAKLGGELPVLELPTDRPRPAVQTHRGAIESLALSKALFDALQVVSRFEGATLFMTLLAAFKTLLYRLSGQEDIVVGSSIANRNRVEIEGLIGFFVNSLAMRTDLAGQPTFRKLLRRVRETALGAYAHQDMPFEKLVEALAPERDLSRTPLFQVFFNHIVATGSTFGELPGLASKVLGGLDRESKFDMTLHVLERERGIELRLVYNTDLFDSWRMVKMLKQYQLLLEAIVSDADQRISELSLLTETERHQILVDWNETQQDYASGKTFVHLFEEQVERSPDAVAVVHGDQNLTYRALDKRANQLAHHLCSLGVGPETVVGLCVERSFEMVAGLLGILKAGGAYVPLDPAYPRERLQYMVKDSGADIIITSRRLLDIVKSLGDISPISIDEDDLFFEGYDNQEVPTNVARPGNLAYVIYTSGSTGLPKGTPIEHKSLVNYLCWFNTQLMVDGGVRLPLITKLTFDASLKQLLAPLLRGDEVLIFPDDVVAQPTRLLQALATHPQFGLNCIPSLWKAIIDALSNNPDMLPLDNLSHLYIGGERLSPNLVKRSFETLPHLRIWNLYGPSETTANACAARIVSQGDVTIGRPIANTQLYILDPYLQVRPIGVPGELHIGGGALARGYLNQPELTAERFIPNPFSDKPGARLYKTGDLVRYRPDGNIEFIGRLDNQVKIRGFRIELEEVGATLCLHPDVSEAVVASREDRPGEKRLVAYVVAAEESAPTTGVLRAFLQEKLPDYMIPSAFVPLDYMPLTAIGKVDRRALPAPDRTRPDLEAVFIAPRTQTEELVARIWCEELGQEKIGMRDNFFDLGGHSLMMVRIQNKLQKIMGDNIPIITLFQYPTIGSLCRYLRREAIEPNSFEQIHGRAKRQVKAMHQLKQMRMARRTFNE